MKKVIFGVASLIFSITCMASEYELTDRQRAAIDQARNNQPALDTKQQNASNEAKNHGCPVSEAEEVVCGNIMCDFGLLMGEYPDRCWDYKAKLIVLKAKLLPWEKLPRCFKRDENCNKTGRAGKEQMDTSYCMDNTDNKNDTELCLGAMRETDASYCGSLGSEVERNACNEIKRTGKLTEEFCTNQAIEKAGIRRQITWRYGITITRTLEWDNLPAATQALYNQVFDECMSLSAK